MHDVFGVSLDEVAGILPAYTRRPSEDVTVAAVNGAPGLVVRDLDGVLAVVSVTVDAGRITAVDVVRNPDKLTSVHPPDGSR
ncbi:hypothetical protein [Streptomyces zhihengii]